MAISLELVNGVELSQETLEEAVKNAITFARQMLPHLPAAVQSQILNEGPTVFVSYNWDQAIADFVTSHIDH